MKKLYELKWEVLSAAEIISSLPENARVPKPMLMRIYSGNAMRLFECSVDRLRSVTITTLAKADNGDEHTLKMTFKPDTKMSLSALTNWLKKPWLDACDTDLRGMTAIKADAVARCLI